MKTKNCFLLVLMLFSSFRLLAQCDYEKSNNTVNIWDWRQEYYSDMHFGEQTPNCIGVLGMRSPFYPPTGGSNNVNLQIFYNQFTDANNISSVDCQPTDGWELLAKEFGSFQNPTPTPFFCLYNRYTGLVRAFFLVSQDIGLQNGASIKMHHLINSTGRESAIFSHLYPVTKSVQEFIKSSEMTNLNYYLNNECYWLYADFPMAYDPCVCWYESKIIFECQTIATMDVKLSGTINGYLNQIVGTTSGNVTGRNNIFDMVNGAVKSGNKSYGSWEKTTKALEEFAKKQEIDVETPILFGASKLKDLFTAIPYLGAAFGVLEYFQGLGKPAGTGNSTPMQFGSNLEFQGIGTIQQSNPIGSRIYWTPGSNQNVQTEKTIYDNPIGVVSFLKPIAIEWVEYQYVDQPTYLTPTMMQYKIAAPVKYALNPSAKVEVTEIQASLVMRYKAMSVSQFNTLLNSYAPYGVTFPRPVGFVNTPKFTDKVNSVGLETELFAYNTNRDSVIVSLRTPYVPLSCFHNTSVFLHGSWGDDGVELITKFIIKARSIDQPEKEIIFLQSYFPSMFNNEEQEQMYFGWQEGDGQMPTFYTQNGNAPAMSAPFYLTPANIKLENTTVNINQQVLNSLALGKNAHITSISGSTISMKAGYEIVIEENTLIENDVELLIGLPNVDCDYNVNPMQYTQDEINTFCSQGGIYDNHSMSKKGLDIEDAKNYNNNEKKEFIELGVVNPFVDNISVFYSLLQNGPISFTVYNITGKIIFEAQLSNSQKGSYSEIIDVSNYNLPEGLYVMEFKSQQSNAKRVKLIKTR